jgi:hypothetical protein
VATNRVADLGGTFDAPRYSRRQFSIGWMAPLGVPGSGSRLRHPGSGASPGRITHLSPREPAPPRHNRQRHQAVRLPL